MLLARGDAPALLVRELPTCLGVAVCLRYKVAVAPGSSSTSADHAHFLEGEPIVAAYVANRLTCSWILLSPPPVLRTVLLPPSKTHCPAWLFVHGIHLCRHMSALCFQLVHLVHTLTVSSALVFSGLSILLNPSLQSLSLVNCPATLSFLM